MSPYNLLFQLRTKHRSRGFSLVELMLYLAISSLIAMTIFSLLSFIVLELKKIENEEEIQLNGRYAIEYIKNEVKRADKILAIEKIEGLAEKYEDNIGFIIFNFDPYRENGYSFNYITYYHENNKIIRIAANRNTKGLPWSTSFGGHNIVADYVSSIEGTGIDFEKKIIKLNFTLEDVNSKKYIFKSIISIRCTVEN